MPMEKQAKFERFEAISLKNWKDGETKTLTFIDNDKDVPNTPQGLMYIVHVTEGKKKETRELWIRPGGSLNICLQNFVPLQGKTLKITKTLGATAKDTRYTAEE